MKKLLLIVFILSSQSIMAQQDSAYKALLNMTREVPLTDSLLLNAIEINIEPLDTFTIKKWFTHALSISNNNRLKNRNYYLAGKITYNSNFDLLVIVEEKKKADVTGTQVVYLVSAKKNGNYISSLEVAVSGVKNKGTYYTTSKLYKDNKLQLDKKFNINDSSYADVNTYKINKSGRFLLAPSY